MVPPPVMEIDPAQVDLQEHPFKVPEAGKSALLKESLAAVGLLSSPRVKPRADGRFQVVTGFWRLKAVLSLGWPRVEAVILEENLPEVQELLLYLHDNAFSRPFTPLEQALLARKLSAHWPEETVRRTFLPLLGLPPALGFLKRLLAVATLEDSWQGLVGEGRLALSTGARLAAWSPKDRLAAWPFLADLPWTQSQQEELLEGVEILARREGGSPARIFSREELREALRNPGSQPRERLEEIRRLLKRWLSPRLVRTEEAFTAALADLGLKNHPRLRVVPPPAFEGRDFRFEIKFQDGAELEQHLKEIGRLTADPRFSRLLSL